MIVMAGRLLLAHGPALLAWYLAGTLGRYLGIQLAGYVGGYTALGGILLLPLAILAKLVSLVAMFLVLRDGMPRLGVIAPPPADGRARREAFRDALLSATLPFIAVYAVLGFLVEDVASYLSVALAVKVDRDTIGILTGTDVDTSGAVADLTWEPWTIGVVALAFAGRWAWKRWQAQLPRWTSVGATYLEGLWVFLSVYFIGEALGQVSAWVDSRQAIAWLGEARAWVGGWFAPLGWTWDAVLWLIGQAGVVLLVPLAWLTIAGVVYGQAVVPQGVRLRGELVTRARTRYSSVPARLRRRLTDIGAGMGARFRPIWRAIVLMWRGGPVLIGGYVLLYVILLLAGQVLRIGVTRVVGPQDFETFWLVAGTPLLLIVPLVIEPLRTVLIASAYDSTIGALIGAPVVESGHEESGHDDAESQEARQLVSEREVEAERAADTVGQEVGDLDGERSGRV
ncbi:hypothetical protein CVS47_00031 [Microbacterium lemovicicum]|uniref:Uncharacterized protein n=1 Tax=Microbacterium lemovicicum TaxID=1072463 RepID=A0A3Q9IVP4_9MICO|nr:hypothetical protein [Microbacterium lemovicicum]AZS35439.1 hypothetical protein CVS47_00031 [Microbacterium lemovicicum]